MCSNPTIYVGEKGKHYKYDYLPLAEALKRWGLKDINKILNQIFDDFYCGFGNYLESVGMKGWDSTRHPILIVSKFPDLTIYITYRYDLLDCENQDDVLLRQGSIKISGRVKQFKPISWCISLGHEDSSDDFY